MQDEKWMTADLLKVFRLKERGRSPTSIFGAEQRGEIPKPGRIARGRISARCWETKDIPAIGRRLGFLPELPEQEVICVYTAKGGVLKTSMAFAIARLCALNGLKTLVVGLDIQCSITDLMIPRKEVERLEDVTEETCAGLYHLFYEGFPLSRVIRKTAIPTLDLIPENPEINDLERRMRSEKRQEYIFADKFMSYLSKYEVVIFDNGPSWNLLVENSLVASNTIVAPAGCDLGTYQALKTNLKRIHSFQRIMKINWSNFFLVPTLLEKTKLSQQIYAAYVNLYRSNILEKPIRRAIKGQEAHLMQKSVVEHHPKSPLASDYYEMMAELWMRIRKAQGDTAAA